MYSMCLVGFCFGLFFSYIYFCSIIIFLSRIVFFDTKYYYSHTCLVMTFHNRVVVSVG